MSMRTPVLNGNLDDFVQKFCVCPETGGNLLAVRDGDELLGFYCSESQRVYPVISDIPIILPDSARNAEIEGPLVSRISEISQGALKQAAQKTLSHLEQRRGILSWEWEDEEFWQEKYASQAASGSEEKNWNDRIWEREPLIESVGNLIGFERKCIVDVGCDEGQNFRNLIASHISEDSIYIATDISLAALQLNRMRNPHKNSHYILCTADRLPMRPGTVDILMVFGILHHTEHKARTISRNLKLFSSHSAMVFVEAVDRTHFGKLLPRSMRAENEESAHEERIDEAELWRELSKSGLQVEFRLRQHTVFYSLMMRLFQQRLISDRSFFRRVVSIDRGLVRVLGSALPPFRAGVVGGVALRISAP